MLAFGEPVLLDWELHKSFSVFFVFFSPVGEIGGLDCTGVGFSSPSGQLSSDKNQTDLAKNNKTLLYFKMGYFSFFW